jgi:hypothetical protein
VFPVNGSEDAGGLIVPLLPTTPVMSYDIQLVDPVTKKALHAQEPHQITGGTCAMGGTTELWLNITYNYSSHYYRAFGENGIRTIYGMTGAASIPVLQDAISSLGDDVNDDYWAPTEGNAKRALCQLVALAQLRPDGAWSGD